MFKWAFGNYYVNTLLFAPDGDSGIGDISDLGTLQDDDNDDKDEKEEDTDDETEETREKPDKTDTDDNEGEDNTETEDDDKEDNDDDDEKESEEDKEDEDTEEEKLLSSWTDIKKAYPDFASKFPDVKAAIFRDQQYGSMFASPKDAEAVVEKAETLDKMGNDLVANGDPIPLLDEIGKQNKDSLAKIALSILPYFQEKDKDLYYEIAAVPIKQLLRSAYASGKGKAEGGKDNDLAKSALHLHNYFFENLDLDKTVKGETKVSNEKSAKEKELEEKLNSINKKEEEGFLNSIDDSYISKMNKHIREGLDKDDRLTEWMKAKITDDALKEIAKQTKADERHMKSMTSMFKQARTAGFTNDFKTRLVNTALVRAKSLVPKVRQRLVADALGKQKPKEKSTTTSTTTRTGITRPKVETRKPSGTPKPKTDLDLLRA